MWPDNETERDFLNFSGVAGTVAEIITQAAGRPTSIGISGSWGAGKSSMIKLVRASLEEKNQNNPKKFIYVEFNAWLYQGYDDARAALLDVIATKLNEEAEERKTGVDKAKGLLQRVNWLRVAKLSAESALAANLGLLPTGLLGEAVGFGKRAFRDDLTEGSTGDIESQGVDVLPKTEGLIKSKPVLSPPSEIHAIRECFERTLDQMDVTLVVLIDDLDRCLPPTTISTLEAIRLFLFLNRTAFVIAADESMIKHAVRQHFGNIEDELILNYFDKLIQIPIRVPPLGTQEVRAYMLLLFIEAAEIDASQKEAIRKSVCAQLAKTWRGERVDRGFMIKVFPDAPSDLVARFDTADRLAPIMANARQIAGNPRLVKRFLNALSIRMAISRAHGVGVDEAVLAKMLLFERCGNPKAYEALMSAVNSDPDGKPTFLTEWEQKAATEEKYDLDHIWDDPFIREWLRIKPSLADTDMRGVLYVSREHAPLITPGDRLSSEGIDLLSAILGNPEMAEKLHDRLTALPRAEISIIMDKVLERAGREQKWGAPPILDACISVAKADLSLGPRVAGFLSDRPPDQIKPSIVPRISDEPWATDILTKWEKNDKVSESVKKSIKVSRKK
ncbi:KAP family P-loop NTPase fold protein [Thioalkalivibrio sp. HK1]|uniref:KAP family P-loop NTPase fold protein n=1 Tax=Thioalkalivibrio sp. HK1 TaxID=1469245 RepID=UPI0004B099D5|nr:P-loop NTPase fold protein [Thioalkalivibrio sp. HK1]